MSALTTDSGVTGEYDRLIEHNGKSCRCAYGHGNSTLVRILGHITSQPQAPLTRPNHAINQMIHEIITGQGLWGIKGSKNTYWVQIALKQ